MVYYAQWVFADKIAQIEPYEYAKIIEYNDDGTKRTAYTACLCPDDANAKEVYSYEGNVCTVKSFYGNTPHECEKLVFDDNGLLVEKHTYSDHEQKKARYKETYEYENGRRTRKYEFFAEDISENVPVQRGELYKYDKRGNISHIADLCNCCPFYDTPDGVGWRRYTYKNFDLHGNWCTKRRCDALAYNKKVTHRTILYWE